MRLLEYQAKDFLSKAGFKVPDGFVVEKNAVERDLGELYRKISFPVVAKVQIPMGRRGLAGGVRIISHQDELVPVLGDMFNRKYYGFYPEKILLEKKIDYSRELYLGVTYDSGRRSPVLIFSLAGGIEVERGESKILGLTTMYDNYPFRIKNFFIQCGLKGKQLITVTELARKMIDVFFNNNLTLLEINPFFETEKGYVVGDAHIEVDDESNQLGYENEFKSEFEKRAEKIDNLDYRGTARLVEFSGDIGLIIGGGGASLTIFDAVIRYGGSPANYCEVGGNPTVKKVTEITKLILSRRVKGLLVITNVLNNTRVDLIARGVIKGILEYGMDPKKVIGIFRVPGAWEEEGKKILTRYGIPFAGREVSLDEAVKKGLERLGGE